MPPKTRRFVKVRSPGCVKSRQDWSKSDPRAFLGVPVVTFGHHVPPLRVSGGAKWRQERTKKRSLAPQGFALELMYRAWVPLVVPSGTSWSLLGSSGVHLGGKLVTFGRHWLRNQVMKIVCLENSFAEGETVSSLELYAMGLSISSKIRHFSAS